MTTADRALAARLETQCKARDADASYCDEAFTADIRASSTALTSALDEIERLRAETIEECARVAEDDDGHFSHYGEDRNTRIAQETCKAAAAAIRTLHRSGR